jgi:hypothetical protein
MKILSAVAAMILFAVGAMAQTSSSSNAVPFLGDIPQFHLTTNKLSDDEIQGRNLAQQLANAKPAENLTNVGFLQIRDAKGNHTDIPIKCKTIVNPTRLYYLGFPTNWLSVYEAHLTNELFEGLQVIHRSNFSNRYLHDEGSMPEEAGMQDQSAILSVKEYEPFAHSDFWLCDLGLEFFHWPEQKILKKENRRSRVCNVLESTNPNPSTNGYSRVVSWIDSESGGIVHAEAFDAQNKLLKIFDPKSFKKVNGQWELQEMEIRNVRTGSRSRIEFDLKN